MTNIIDTLNKEEIARVTENKNIPEFSAGDTVRVNVKIKEGERERVQAYEGVCIARTGGGLSANFTVRKISFGEGVERVFPRLAYSEICDLTCAGLETIAIRCPNHEVAYQIIKGFGAPIAAPSANISGHVSPTSAHHVESEFGDNLPVIIDGGECQIGLESTVVAVFENEVTLLRYGAITIEEIENVINAKVKIANLKDENSPKSPGMLLKHYSPNAPLFLNCDNAQDNEVLIGFGDMDCQLNLSKTSNLQEAAANLYKMIRQADAQKPHAIKIAPIPNNGIGAAINDRLTRAAEK